MVLSQIARMVALFGLILLLVAGILFLLPLGNLPGDIKIERENFTGTIPIISSLIMSVVLTVIINLVLYFLKK